MAGTGLVIVILLLECEVAASERVDPPFPQMHQAVPWHPGMLDARWILGLLSHRFAACCSLLWVSSLCVCVCVCVCLCVRWGLGWGVTILLWRCRISLAAFERCWILRWALNFTLTMTLGYVQSALSPWHPSEELCNEVHSPHSRGVG